MQTIHLDPDYRKQTYWKRFLLVFITIAFSLFITLFILIAVINPYNNLPVSLEMERFRVTGNERYALPAFAKSNEYDSALFGTSTSMLLRPSDLNNNVVGKFVNLSMGSATPHEQLELLALFLRHHDQPKKILIGIDVAWCSTENPSPLYTFRPFPPWQYDENQWNDYLYLLNTRTIVHSLRLFKIKLGLSSPRYGEDGYFQFVPDTSEYIPGKALSNLYKDGIKRPFTEISKLMSVNNSHPPKWSYPDLQKLKQGLASIPDETEKILFFPPYHFAHIDDPRQWKKYYYCKKEVTEIVSSLNHTYLVDFMIPSDITMKDSNYWDPLHYTLEVAKTITQIIGDALNEVNISPDIAKILWPQKKQVNKIISK